MFTIIFTIMLVIGALVSTLFVACAISAPKDSWEISALENEWQYKAKGVYNEEKLGKNKFAVN